MKKLIMMMLLSVSIIALTGCGKTQVAYDLEYVETLQTESNTKVLFKDNSGELIGFDINQSDLVLLTKGEEYNVEYTLSTFWEYGQYVENITPSN